MDVNKFNLLIGEQATGKSTIAKSVYFFKMIKTTIIHYLTQICDTNLYKNEPQDDVHFDKAIRRDLKDVFIRLFGYSWDLDPKFKMKYEYAPNIEISVALYDGDRKGKKLIGVNYSPALFAEIEKLRREAVELYNTNMHTLTTLALANEQRKQTHDMITKRVNAIFADDMETYYIPAGRSLLTVMSSNRATMNSATNLDMITEQFMMMIDSVRNSFSNGVRRAYQFYPVEHRNFDVNALADMIVRMQKGEYFSKNGQEELHISGDESQSIKINFASSGQQEILWLLNFLYILLLKQEKAFVIIEEPEAHVYPTLQRELVEFIAMYANMHENSVFITTHSPYVLNVINNLYYAGMLVHDGHGRAVYDIVSKKKIINCGSLSAFKLINNNSAKKYVKLLDEEEREIRASLIDEVSSSINEVYTALYNIELDNE